jgi:multimeric flavodoxin WrbA
MKVLLISGSPRDGNSESILRKIQNMISTAEQLNDSIETELLLLREKNIQRYEGCVEY